MSTKQYRTETGAKSSQSPCLWWFAMVPLAIAFDNRLISIDTHVLIHVMAYAGEKGWTDVSNKRLARYITASLKTHKSVTDKTIAASLKRLELYGYIRREDVPQTDKNATGRIIHVTFSEEAMLTQFPAGVPVPKSFRESAARFGGLSYKGHELKVVGGANPNSPLPGGSDSPLPPNLDSHKVEAHSGEEQKKPTRLHSGAPVVALSERASSGEGRDSKSSGGDPQGDKSRGVLANLPQRASLNPAVSCWPQVDGCSLVEVDRVFGALSDFVTEWTTPSKLDMGNVIWAAVEELGKDRGLAVVMYAVEVIRNDEKRGRKKPDIVLPYLAKIVTNKLDDGGLKASERPWKKPKGGAGKSETSKGKADPAPPEIRRAAAEARRVRPDLDPDDADGYEPFQSRPSDILPPSDQPTPPAMSNRTAEQSRAAVVQRTGHVIDQFRADREVKRAKSAGGKASPRVQLTETQKARLVRMAEKAKGSGLWRDLTAFGAQLKADLGVDHGAETLASCWEHGWDQLTPEQKVTAGVIRSAGVVMYKAKGFRVVDRPHEDAKRPESSPALQASGTPA